MSRLHHSLALLIVITGLTLGSTGCLEDPFTGSKVYLRFQDLPINNADEHYEMFANINGGAVSVKKFKVNDEQEVIDFETEIKYGTVNYMASPPKGGVIFYSEVDCWPADSVFFTIEKDGDTDPVPSGNTVLRGELEDGVRGVRSGKLSGSIFNPFTRQELPLSGEIAVVGSEDLSTL